MRLSHIISGVCILLLIVSCEKDFDNPNASTPGGAVKTQDGLVNMVVGMKNRFAVNSAFGNGTVFTSLTVNGLTTFELSAGPGGNLDFNQLNQGQNAITPNNGIITDLWSNCLQTNYTASLILENLNGIEDTTIRNNVERYALLYKAMSIGTMVNFWEKVPVETGDRAVFLDSTAALQVAIGLLNRVITLPDASNGSKLGPEINLRNSALALSARYHLMVGSYDSAILRAAAVDIHPARPAARSVFIYNNQNANPVFLSGFNSQFSYRPNTLMGLDRTVFPFGEDTLRLQRYTVDQNPLQSFGSGFWNTDADSIPIYLPGEMLLIQAEAYVRKGDLVNGKIFLDRVLTKRPSQDAFRIGASLDPYAGPMTQEALLLEIYRNRCVELYMSGLKLADSRRFRRPGPKDARPERKRNYFPYPQSEALGNSNTPPNPDI